MGSVRHSRAGAASRDAGVAAGTVTDVVGGAAAPAATAAAAAEMSTLEMTDAGDGHVNDAGDRDVCAWLSTSTPQFHVWVHRRLGKRVDSGLLTKGDRAITLGPAAN